MLLQRPFQQCLRLFLRQRDAFLEHLRLFSALIQRTFSGTPELLALFQVRPGLSQRFLQRIDLALTVLALSVDLHLQSRYRLLTHIVLGLQRRQLSFHVLGLLCRLGK